MADKSAVIGSPSSVVQTSAPAAVDNDDGGAASISHLNLSKSFEEYIQQVDVATAMAFVRDGGYLQKYPRPAFCRQPHPRLFQVDMDNLVLRWLSPKKNVKKTFVALSSVIAFIPGNRSAFFARRPEEQPLAFELVCPHFHLRLVCPNAEEYRLWIRGLVYALARAEAKRRRGVLFETRDFYRRVWDTADVDGSGAVSFIELYDAVRRLDLRTDMRYLKHLFIIADQDASGVLDYIEFRSVVERLLTSAQLAAQFVSYRDPQRDLIKIDGLHNFILDVQGEGQLNEGRITSAVRELRNILSEPGGITLAGFCKLMRSEWNSLVDPDKKANDQDMSLPLHSYWIYSLCDPFDLPQPDFRRRKSLLRALEFALLRGVRFIMAKIFVDPLDAQNVVVGRMNRSAAEIGYRDCKFIDFLRCIRDNAFKITVYPLILHLEFLCSPNEKGLAGRMIKEVLTGMLYINPQDGSVPMLEDVMKRVIISTAILQPSDPDRSELTGCDTDSRLNRLMAEMLLHEVDEGGLHLLHIPPQRYPNENLPRLNKIQRENITWLAHVTGLPAQTLRPTDVDRHPFSIYGINTSLMMEQNPSRVTTINRSTMAFCYPGGYPQIQTNRGFAYALARGFQCVALNRACGGVAAILQESLFDLNGRCGYVRRPDVLNDVGATVSPRSGRADLEDVDIPAELTISVLEGSQLPRGHVGLDTQRDHLCPFVTVAMRGLPGDCKSYNTRVVINNGFNPIWGEQSFSFRIRAPSVAFLVFEVRNYEDPGASTLLGGAACLLSSIRPGLRWVTLRDRYGRTIPWAGLLVRATLKFLRREAPAAAGAAPVPQLKAQPPLKAQPSRMGMRGGRRPGGGSPRRSLASPLSPKAPPNARRNSPSSPSHLVPSPLL